MDAAVLCPVCKWFGVFRADVAGSIVGCPNCGHSGLCTRPMDDERIAQFGNSLLEELDTGSVEASDPDAARRGTW